MTNNNYAMPAQLTGKLSEFWNEVKTLAGNNPEAPVKFTTPDQEKMGLIISLAAVGGCSYDEVADGVEVKLCFAPEVPAEEEMTVGAVVKPHKFAAYAMPAQLTGKLSEFWNEVKTLAGNNPEAPVKFTTPDQEKMGLIISLAAVGGCSYDEVADGVEVKLCFAPEVPAEEEKVVEAVVKPHKFAKGNSFFAFLRRLFTGR